MFWQLRDLAEGKVMAGMSGRSRGAQDKVNR
jgi:hypothetical protein